MNVVKVLHHFNLLAAAERYGQEIKVICPFHGDTEASMSVNVASTLYHCLGCGASGNGLGLVKRLGKLDDLEAYVLLAKLDALAEPDFDEIAQSDEELLKAASRFYDSLVSPAWDVRTTPAVTYVADRGLLPQTLRYWGVRVNPVDARPVVFPLVEDGVFKGYVTRVIDESVKPKYRFNYGFKRDATVAGEWTRTDQPTFVVEGIVDAIMGWQHGMMNIYATQGWSITEAQARKIQAHGNAEVVCLFDNDEAGERGWALFRELFHRPVRRMYLPEGKDVATVTQQELREAAKEAGVKWA